MALKRRTTIIIAQSLSTIRKAAKICVVSGGKIAEQGTHQQLLQADASDDWSCSPKQAPVIDMPNSFYRWVAALKMKAPRLKSYQVWENCLPIKTRFDEEDCAGADRTDLLMQTRTPGHASVLHMLLVDVYTELEQAGGEPALVFGTLLGAVRDGGIIPFTEDVDTKQDHGRDEPRRQGVVFQATTRASTYNTEREYVKISLPRFSGGTAQNWLKWSHKFGRLCQLKKWAPDEKDLNLQLVLKNEALEAWHTASEDKDMNSVAQFTKAYALWGRTYVPKAYNEQLEEDLFMSAKRRNERMREVARMLRVLPTNPMNLDDKSMIRYFKCAMPRDWRHAYECSGITFSSMPQSVQYFERLEQSERREGQENKGKPKTSKPNKQYGNYHGKNSSHKKWNNNHTNKASSSNNAELSGKWCKLHKTASHSDQECFTQKKNDKSSYNQKSAAKKSENRKLTSALGIIVNFRDGKVEWNGNSVVVSTGNAGTYQEIPDKKPKRHLPVELKEVEILDEVKDINDTSVKPMDLIGDADIDQETYDKVVKLLASFEMLYNVQLGKMKLPDHVLPIVEPFIPVHARPYSVPRSEEDAARKERHRLITVDVLEQIFDSEMASPAFFLKKSDGRLRLLTDFQALNRF
ncbi:hypothetical protein PInf_005013 [Phytophthora infestans]|nr:hypothetical protein PInf_005013 [Phytophthora infestans]